MTEKRFFALVMILALLALTGCEEYATYTPNALDLTAIAQLPAGPTKSAVQATAVARYVAAEGSKATVEAAGATARAAAGQQATAQARERHQRAQMTAEAQAIADQATAEVQAIEDARASAAAATQQALNVRATEQALHLAATQQVMNWNATATAEAHNATSTSVAQNATATLVTRLDNAQATAVEATAASVARLDRRETYLEPIRAMGLLLLALVFLSGLAALGVYLVPILKRRLHVIRRAADEGETLVLMERGPNGEERIGLPLRTFRAILDGKPVPDERQAEATMRQQTANAIQARQVGKISQAKSKNPGRVVVQQRPTRAQRRRRQRQRTEPGLMGVTPVAALEDAAESGMLPPQLAQAIEARWTEVEEV